jgi:hypothetical protein
VSFAGGFGIVHECCHAVAAWLCGDRQILIQWTVTHLTVDNLFVTYAGYFGTVLIFGTVGIWAGLRAHPLVSGFFLGAVLADLPWIHTTQDWADARALSSAWSVQIMTIVFFALAVTLLLFGTIACAYGVAKKLQGVDKN